MKKRILLLLLACMVCIGLAACGSGVSREEFEALQSKVDILIEQLETNSKEAENTEDALNELLFNINESTIPVTNGAYHEIIAGMDYNSIARLIGDYGILEAQVGQGSDMLLTVKWNVHDESDVYDESDGFVHCQFQGNQLVKKWADYEYKYWDITRITIEQFLDAYPQADEAEYEVFLEKFSQSRRHIYTGDTLSRIPSEQGYVLTRWIMGDYEIERPSLAAWNSIIETMAESVRE